MCKKRICVLMSTYNGEKYVKDQILSIISQNDISVTLVIRDDGSTDKTVAVIKSIENKSISLIIGENWGYKKSFFYLLCNAPSGYDYYAFADQDDIWLPDKLATAIKNIRKYNRPAACCSKPCYVDESLNIISDCCSVLDKLPYGVVKQEWALATGLFGLGCTFVWNSEMQTVVREGISGIDTNFGHDNFMSILAPSVGILIHSREETILYRQHNNNTSGNKTIKKTFIERLINIIMDKDDLAYKMRKNILNAYSPYMNDETRLKLVYTIEYKKNIVKKIRLLKANYTKGMNLHERIKNRMLILFNRY